jgi:hypothetical protein
LYRYSQTISTSLSAQIISLDEVNDFIRELNEVVNLKKLSKKAVSENLWKQMFYLVSKFCFLENKSFKFQVFFVPLK